MSNPYLDYYVNQAGSGIPGFSGVRYQRGHGFFSSLFRIAMPLLRKVLPSLGKTVGKQVLSSGVGLAQDVLGGTKFKDAAKSRLKEGAAALVEKAAAKIQGGQGRRRRNPQRGKCIKRAKAGKKPKRKSRKSRNDFFG